MVSNALQFDDSRAVRSRWRTGDKLDTILVAVYGFQGEG
jgi:hypothetical protein